MRVKAFIAGCLLATNVHASELMKLEASAMKCDYYGMRNYAYAHDSGDAGAMKNPKTACKWRVVVLMSGRKSVDASDISNYDYSCSKIDSGTKMSLAIEAHQLARKICK